MFSSQRAEHSLNLPCRKISAVTGDTENHRFLVGSCILPTRNNPTPNEIHLLRFHEDMNELGTDYILDHPTGEVWELNPYPGDRHLVLTSGSSRRKGNSNKVGVTGGGGGSEELDSKTVLWKMPTPPEDEYYGEDDDDDEDRDLTGMANATTATLMESRTIPMEESLCIPMEDDTILYGSVWNSPEEEPMNLITLTSSSSSLSSLSTSSGKSLVLSQWDLQYGTPTEPIYQTVLPYSHASSSSTTSPKVVWDPHNTNLIAFSHGQYISIHDVRTPSSTTSSGTTAAMMVDSNESTPTMSKHTSIRQQRQRYRRPFHRYNVTDLDYNPNRPHIMATGGEDALLKFWDLRTTTSTTTTSFSSASSPSANHVTQMDSWNLSSPTYEITGTKSSYPYLPQSKNKQKKIPQRPIKICRGGHSHHITTVKYNPFHDPLLLSSGTDSIVNLWRISSISSSPMMELLPSTKHDNFMDDVDVMNDDDAYNDYDDDDDYDDPLGGHESDLDKNNNDDEDDMSSNQGPDIRVTKVEHQESVYDVAWSKCDAWVWASVALDGNVILSHVPSKEKYKILL